MLKLRSKQVGPPGGYPYTQPETVQSFRGHSFTAVIRKIATHRNAHGLPMEPGWEEVVEDQMCLEIGDSDWCHDPANPVAYMSALQRMGRKLWESLHAYAKTLPLRPLTGAERVAVKEWLRQWENSIPNWGGCNCRQHYHDLKQDLPVDLSTGEDFWLWTVAVHNAVNQLLGKPVWTPA